MGAPIGNQNAVKGKRWQEAILRALARHAKSVDGGLDQAANKLIQLAMRGDKWALDHLADRIDGKAPQDNNVNLSGGTDITVRGV